MHIPLRSSEHSVVCIFVSTVCAASHSQSNEPSNRNPWWLQVIILLIRRMHFSILSSCNPTDRCTAIALNFYYAELRPNVSQITGFAVRIFVVFVLPSGDCGIAWQLTSRSLRVHHPWLCSRRTRHSTTAAVESASLRTRNSVLLRNLSLSTMLCNRCIETASLKTWNLSSSLISFCPRHSVTAAVETASLRTW
jgi:hypothetical protein